MGFWWLAGILLLALRPGIGITHVAYLWLLWQRGPTRVIVTSTAAAKDFLANWRPTKCARRIIPCVILWQLFPSYDRRRGLRERKKKTQNHLALSLCLSHANTIQHCFTGAFSFPCHCFIRAGFFFQSVCDTKLTSSFPCKGIQPRTIRFYWNFIFLYFLFTTVSLSLSVPSLSLHCHLFWADTLCA